MSLNAGPLTILRRFARAEDGLVLTEYLIMLGLLAGASIMAIFIFGSELGLQWAGWGDWIGNERLSPPES